MKILSIVMVSILSMGLLNAATDETVTLGGNKVKLVGDKVSVGDAAPKVTLVSSELKEVSVGG